MKIPKNLNQPSRLMGVDIATVGLVVGGVAFMQVLLVMYETFVDSVPTYVNLAVVLAGVIALVAMKRANKNENPSHLVSTLSYRYVQPKKIEITKKPGYERKTIAKAIEEREREF